jgi:ATP-binding cassette subfamily A (ABC1) protein 3
VSYTELGRYKLTLTFKLQSKFCQFYLELMTGISLKIHQFKAMFMKRLLHSKRNKAALFTQFLLPLMMTLLGLAIAKSVKPISDEPSRMLGFKNLSVDNKLTNSMFASFSSKSNLTFQVANFKCF